MTGSYLLEDIIIPEIISQKKTEGTKKIHAWSCGAAFGEEAYSVAILLCEALGSRLNDLDIQILATDIDKNALAEAPWGSYDRNALGNMGAHLLFKYFTRAEICLYIFKRSFRKRLFIIYIPP